MFKIKQKITTTVVAITINQKSNWISSRQVSWKTYSFMFLLVFFFYYFVKKMYKEKHEGWICVFVIFRKHVEWLNVIFDPLASFLTHSHACIQYARVSVDASTTTTKLLLYEPRKFAKSRRSSVHLSFCLRLLISINSFYFK